MEVTILILIDGFLQYMKKKVNESFDNCHNPYFNRWFSAISKGKTSQGQTHRHNPYFNRWFSAILGSALMTQTNQKSQSLF